MTVGLSNYCLPSSKVHYVHVSAVSLSLLSQALCQGSQPPHFLRQAEVRCCTETDEIQLARRQQIPPPMHHGQEVMGSDEGAHVDRVVSLPQNSEPVDFQFHVSRRALASKERRGPPLRALFPAPPPNPPRQHQLSSTQSYRWIIDKAWCIGT